MENSERKYIRELIWSRIHQLEASLSISDEIITKNQANDNAGVQPDRAISGAIKKKTTDDAKKELKRLNENLEWIESDEAGLCDSCGCVIAAARLKALLITRLCVACAERQEGKV